MHDHQTQSFQRYLRIVDILSEQTAVEATVGVARSQGRTGAVEWGRLFVCVCVYGREG
jgi:hypothetical protein